MFYSHTVQNEQIQDPTPNEQIQDPTPNISEYKASKLGRIKKTEKKQKEEMEIKKERKEKPNQAGHLQVQGITKLLLHRRIDSRKVIFP